MNVLPYSVRLSPDPFFSMSLRYTVLIILFTTWAKFATRKSRKKSVVLQDTHRFVSSGWLFGKRLATMSKLGIWRDTRGQDMIEYALIAALVTVAAIAVVPGISVSLSTIFSKIASTMTAAASTS
jgi:pilus assembly protein Flp/PilA